MADWRYFLGMMFVIIGGVLLPSSIFMLISFSISYSRVQSFSRPQFYFSPLLLLPLIYAIVSITLLIIGIIFLIQERSSLKKFADRAARIVRE